MSLAVCIRDGMSSPLICRGFSCKLLSGAVGGSLDRETEDEKTGNGKRKDRGGSGKPRVAIDSSVGCGLYTPPNILPLTVLWIQTSQPTRDPPNKQIINSRDQDDHPPERDTRPSPSMVHLP